MKNLTRSQKDEIQSLELLRDDEIDLSDIPVRDDRAAAVVGKFYRPIKKSLTIRIDADVLAQLKAGGRGYQTRINGILRRATERTRHGDTQLIRLTDYGVWPLAKKH